MITPNLFKILRALCIAVGISAVALNAGAAPRNLIVKANQLSSNCSYSGSNAGDQGPLSNLIDGNPDTYWHADYSDGTHTALQADEYYIQINNIGKISSGVSLEFFFTQRNTPNNHVEEFTIQIHKTTDAAGTFTTLPYPLVLTDVRAGASCNVVYNIPPLLNSASYIFDQIRLVPRKITSFDGGVSSYYTSNGTFHLAELQIKTKQILFNGEQMWSNCNCNNGSDDVTPLSNLLDYNPATFWHSDYNTTGHTAPVLDQYIIDVFWFGTIPAGTPLHFYFQQRQITGWHVSKVRIQVHQTSTNDEDFVDLGELALQNVKSLGISQNSIASIPCDIDKIRIIVTQRGDDNDNRQVMDANNPNPGFHLSELHIATEPITIHGHGSPVNMRNTQYANVPNNPTYNAFSFHHTQGAVDPVYYNNYDQNGDGQNNNFYWQVEWDKFRTGNYPDADLLRENNIKAPDFSFLNSGEDSRIKNGERQRSHVVEHTVYALPGYTAMLLPFSDFATQPNFYVQMLRWYDYATDKRSDDLYYFDFPERLIRTDYGDLAGCALTDPEGSYFGLVPAFWTNDVDFTDKYIAMDAYQYADKSIHFSGGKFHEPIVSFRHIFNIKNGLKFAEELSASKEANDKYVKKNKRVIAARANTDLQVRLTNPVPAEKVSMDMFYLDNNGNAKRVYHPYIEVTKPDGSVVYDQIFSFGKGYTSRGGYAYDYVNNRTYELGELGKQFDRFLMCSAADALPGTYKIRLLARDENENPVKIRGTQENLAIAEYEITFMNPDAAILVPESSLSEDRYKHTLNSYISGEDGLKLGEPRAKVDFDEYCSLIGNSNYTKPINQNWGVYNYKWPRPWETSNYCFGYHQRNDYNMYVLATNTLGVPYSGATGSGQQSEIDANFGKGPYLYDRLFYDTKGKQTGFFYYVNASSDPGMMARMKIDDLCSGSTLFVTGWLCECSGGTVENVILNFDAIKKDGTRVTMHSFVSGDVPTIGKWCYFYYSFVPNLDAIGINSADIDHYELSIENNCSDSGGADYAIDDIRVYVAKPRLYATQTMPICAGGTSTTVRVHTPYEVIMATMGKIPDSPEDEQINFYYTFLNKRIFDEKFAEYRAAGDAYAYEKAFDEAVLRYIYNKPGGITYFGRATFHTVYGNNPIFDNEDWDDPRESVSQLIINGERCLTFNTLPTDDKLVVGGEYYMAMYVDEDVTITPTARNFDITGECAKVCSFIIHSSGVVKVDGVPVPDMTNIQVCENQWPMVQVDIYGQHKPSDIHQQPENELLEKNTFMDWFDGPIRQFTTYTYTDGVNTITLPEAIENFRSVPEYLEEEDPTVPAKDRYTELSRQCLIHYSTTFDKTERRRPPLQLHKASYIFPYLTLPDGVLEKVEYCTAIPINRYKEEESGGMVICTEPSEIRVIITNKSPFLKHGINSPSLPYPETMDDVPLRISLNMLKDVSGDIESAGFESAKMLGIPLRWTEAATPGVTRLLQKTDDDYLYLVETNDPAYKALGVPTDSPAGMRAIGRLRKLEAIVDGDKQSNHAMLQFKRDFVFREGYYYKVRFNYQEDKYNQSQTICDGQDVLTLKVVPEFQKWIGKINTCFNNDANWSRVSSDDLLRADSDTDEFSYKPRSTNPENVSSGSTNHRNNTRRSYAPVHFVKAINNIQPDYIALNGVNSQDIPYHDFIANVNVTKQWIKNDNEIAAGNTTADIEFDMVAENHSNGKHVVCRPWQANTCEQMHFNSGSVIYNQKELRYRSASVDFETDPDSWYSLASPLNSVYAGDMYLPTAGARQNTELFRPITFDDTKYHRFRPAVYQRSWNKDGQANVYNLPGQAPDVKNVAIISTWSNAYNDVQEAYAPGHGFSIKTDANHLGANKPGKVSFRLPKADTQYNYYSYDYEAGGTAGVTGTTQAISRTNAGRFVDNDATTVTLSGAVDGKYFMAGNPYLGYLDVRKFLDYNSGLVKQIYVMNGNGTAEIKCENGNIIENGTLNLNGWLPPMQGFFVVTANPVKTVNVTFNTAMINAGYPGSLGTPSTPLHAARSEADEQAPAGMTVTASDADGVLSTAVVTIDGMADKGYRIGEDVELFIDGLSKIPRVYTIAGNNAVTINALDNVESVEVGLVNDDRDVTLTFTNVDAIGTGLGLYDAETGDFTPLHDGLSVNVRGAVAQRLFITSAAADTEAVSTISVTVNGNKVTVNAAFADESLEVQAFDTVGRNVFTASEPSGVATFTLDRGVYIINAAAGKQQHTQKIIIR